MQETPVDNTSGHGKASIVPPEVKRWNWGAFLLNWIWGIGNSTYIAFLCFVPVVNIVMPFVLGAKGSGWAWRNRRWKSIEHFRKTQRKWTLAGLIVCALGVILVLGIVCGVLAVMKHSAAYKLALDSVRNSDEMVEELGTPITPGWWVAGIIEVSGPDGSADLSFPVSGPRAKGTVFVAAAKNLGEWKLHRVVLRVAETDKRIVVTQGK